MPEPPVEGTIRSEWPSPLPGAQRPNGGSGALPSGANSVKLFLREPLILCPSYLQGTIILCPSYLQGTIRKVNVIETIESSTFPKTQKKRLILRFFRKNVLSGSLCQSTYRIMDRTFPSAWTLDTSRWTNATQSRASPHSSVRQFNTAVARCALAVREGSPKTKKQPGAYFGIEPRRLGRHNQIGVGNGHELVN
ncbi:MAG: hypothetical protein MAG794_01075 [Gammaproteobacteria bacterium]|nr:hypothetical protein [Gammaproteobacteria bacterium]